MIVVAIHGKAQSGKGTFSNVLREKWEKVTRTSTLEINFADTLKDACHLIFKISYDDMNTPEGKLKILPHFGNITVRQIFQKLGTDTGRNIYKNIWIWHVEEKLKIAREQNIGLVTISDLRFQNEYDAVIRFGAKIVKTIRSGYEIEYNDHSSETDLDEKDDWDYICDATCSDEVEDHAIKFFNLLLKVIFHVKHKSDGRVFSDTAKSVAAFLWGKDLNDWEIFYGSDYKKIILPSYDVTVISRFLEEIENHPSIL